MKIKLYFPGSGKRIAFQFINFFVLSVAGLNWLHAQYSCYAIINTYSGNATPSLEQQIHRLIVRDAAGYLHVADAELKSSNKVDLIKSKPYHTRINRT